MISFDKIFSGFAQRFRGIVPDLNRKRTRFRFDAVKPGRKIITGGIAIDKSPGADRSNQPLPAAAKDGAKGDRSIRPSARIIPADQSLNCQ